MSLTRAGYDAAIDVPRGVWDPTEGRHPRHGERALESIAGVEVHWTGAGGDLADHGDTDTELLSFERFHEVSKGWTDLFYNVAADTEAFTYEGRDVTVRSQGNLAAWLTLLIVAGPDDNLTGPDLINIESSIRRMWQAVDPGQSPASLRFHRERSATACPGDQIAALVQHIRITPQETPVMPLHPDAQAAADAGIWSGDNPDDPITREHAAIMVQRAKEQVLLAIVQTPAGPQGPPGEPGAQGVPGIPGTPGDAAQALPDPLRVQIMGPSA